MKILLTMIPKSMELKDQQTSFMPLSIYVLAAYVKHSGYKVDVKCYPNPEEINYDSWTEYDAIGFSTNSFNYAESLEVAEKVKNTKPDIKIIFGGIHVTRLTNEALTNSYVDYVIRGEGENAIVELLNTNFEALELIKISGLSYKVGNQIIHNKIKDCIVLDKDVLIPSYELINSKMKNFSFETSRGCQNRCTFCSIDHKYPWRGYEEDVLMKRIDQSLSLIENKEVIESIAFTDDCFTTKSDRAVNILRRLNQKYPNISLRIEARVKDVLNNQQLLNAFAECNLGMIQFGIECGYNYGLQKIRKGITIDEARECARGLNEKKLGNIAFYSYIIGFPWESKKECLETISFAEEILNLYNIPGNIVFWLPLPSTLADEFGLINDQWYKKKGWFNDMSIFLEAHPNLTVHDINEIVPRIKRFLDKSYRNLGIIS